MLPGYGLSPFPDFQPHHHTLHCRGDGPSMWLPGPGKSAALISDAHHDEPLPRPCHHKHVAVCQQETLTFIDHRPPASTRVNGHGSPYEQQCATYAPALDSFKHSQSELIDWAKSYQGTGQEEDPLTSNSCLTSMGAIKCPNGHRTYLLEQPDGGAQSVLSLPLAFPLSSLCTNRDSWDSQIPCSPSSPEGPEFHNMDSYQPQRRTSQGSLKEKSIRRKMQVYSPDSLSDDSLSSPVLEADFLFPVTFASFLEEDLSIQSSQDTKTSPSSTDATADPQNLIQDDILHLPTERLPMLEDSQPGVRQDSQYMSMMAMGCGSTPRSRQVDPERRRFSASELISRLQLSQRKNSFTLKLGKSLSARVASKDRQSSGGLSPDNKSNAKQRSSGGCSESAPNSPVGPAPPPSSSDNGVPTHWWSSKLGIRKRSIEEDLCTSPVVACSNRLSRFLPNSILYQEYSDVAINREIQRQQGKELGTDEDGLRDIGSDGTSSPSSLSPSSSFCSSRGSAFALWQDIPDVRSSGQLDNFSNEQRKLQEAKFELVTSEASYIRSLTIAVDHFMLSQELSECLGAQDKQWLFSKLPEVKDVSERFLHDLESRLEEDILHFDVCDIVLDHCPALRRVYLPYVTNQAYQEQTYQRLLQEKARFPATLARLEEDSVCQRLPLTSFLILPFQRITRLKMLVENILKRTTPGSRDEDTATKAFNELKKIIKECNSSVQSMKRMEELIHLNKKIQFEGKIFPLISQSRWLVKHGELLEVDMQTMSISGSKLKLPTKPVYLHLFNDCLLLSRRKDTWKFLVFVHAKIGELKVKDLSQKLQGISGFIFHLQLCEGQQLKHQILLKSNTERSGKQRWIAAMFPSNPREDIEQASENDGWVEGIRLSDGERGWFPKPYVEEITSRSARLRNLRENIRIKCVTQKLEGEE
ncbi:rho guanine nucleotide exchange factor 19 isoform X6 [Hippocampus comes]|uniref:rho guanine nucleotide exchange factor 19 isoform X6 n=1 Tax=Hippocampus comes TaxID=109280 RepID=UPI00094F2AC3|nr:PREDICTED: rho guanine nucleotide exchange factor 19-like isoform X6 [Hippocampus comes]